MILNQSFTDRHGINHSAATVQIISLDIQNQTSVNYPIDGGDSSSEITANIGYQVVYWPSEAARLASATPLELYDNNGASYFSLSVNEDVTAIQALSLAEQNLESAVLPLLQ